MSEEPQLQDLLCEHLQPLLRSELLLGNSIVETYRDLPVPGGIFIMLGASFRAEGGLTGNVARASCVEFQDVNDPHWWRAEYSCREHHHVLACRFDP